jgi:predicted flap endonuclease-1-like 5' DNA nuclease
VTWLWVIIALVVGFAVGWWWRGREAARHLAEVEATWKTRLDKTEGELTQTRGALAENEERVRSIESDLVAARREAESAEAERDEARHSVADLTRRFEEEQQARRAAEEAAAAAQAAGEEAAAEARAGAAEAVAQLEAARGGEERLGTELASVRADLEAADARAKGLTEQLESERRSTAQLRDESSAHAATAGEAEQAIAERDQYISELEQRLAECKSAAMAAEAARASGAETAQESAPSEPAVPAESAPAPAEADDLQKVKGIGPLFVRLLAEMGITTFRQIATIPDAETEALEERLDTFPGRIVREEWREQARHLHAEKYGESI